MWRYDVKLFGYAVPRYFTSEVRLTEKEIKEMFKGSGIAWFKAVKISDDNETSD